MCHLSSSYRSLYMDQIAITTATADPSQPRRSRPCRTSLKVQGVTHKGCGGWWERCDVAEVNERKRVESKFWEMVIGRRIGDASEKKKKKWLGIQICADESIWNKSEEGKGFRIKIQFRDMEFGRKCRNWEAWSWSLEKHDMWKDSEKDGV